MRYSLEKVATTQACDALRVGAEVKKRNLERRRRNLGESISTFRRRLEQVHNELAQVRWVLETFAVAYEALPEGKDKAGIKVKVKRLELRLAVLEKKAYTYTVEALLVREMKYNQLEDQVFALENYITSITRRRTALSRLAAGVGKVPVLWRQPVFRGLRRQQVVISSIALAQAKPGIFIAYGKNYTHNDETGAAQRPVLGKLDQITEGHAYCIPHTQLNG